MIDDNDTWSANDVAFMKMALEAAKGQLGKTGTSPAVGCVIVKDGLIVGIGATSDGGRPHGEANALAQAGVRAKGGDVYVTLEPCAHVSARGAACSSGLVQAQVARVVACIEDPDPRTAGKGFERLKAAGILCEVGLMRVAGEVQIADFSAQFEK
jgi:diaminohydroxyphosphoribosylaminopyrimidine deaminase / 5-amino-6-(5-phosphoribosylamino)uracil reductase